MMAVAKLSWRNFILFILTGYYYYFYYMTTSFVNGQTSQQPLSQQQQQQAQQKEIIQVGLLFVKDVTNILVSVGYRTSASAVLIGQERIRSAHLLDGYDFNFTIAFDECSESQAAGKAVEMIEFDKVDVLFGPTCNKPALSVAALAAFYDIPVFQWGLTTNSELSDSERFPTTITFSVNSYSLAMAIHQTMRQFQWDQFVFIFSNDGDAEKCDALKNDVQTVTTQFEDVTLTYLYQIGTVTLDSLRASVRAIKTRGRIIVTCFSSGTGFKKAFMQAAYLEDAVTDEYIYIIAETNSRGFIIDDFGDDWHYVWEGSGGLQTGVSTRSAQEAFFNVLFLVDNMGMNENVTPQFQNFSQQVIDRMKDPPFNCVEDCADKNFSSVAKYAGQLADAFYAYGVALNKTLEAHPGTDVRNGTMVMQHTTMTFQGVGSGDVMIGAGVNRLSIIYLIGLNSSRLPETYATLIVDKQVNEPNTFRNFDALYDDESVVWAGGSRPLAVPVCGFSGTECPIDFVQDYLIYTVIVAFIITVAVMAAVFGILYTIHMKQKEMEMQDLLWHVAFFDLKAIKNATKNELSQRSFNSAPSSNSAKFTVESFSETTHVIFYTYQLDIIAAMKHEGRVHLDKEEKLHLRKLRNLENDNLNKFIGLCLDGPQLLSIWKYCSRGSLADVIQKSSMQMDSFFMFSLIRDISNGLVYIHNSYLEIHGHLTSRCCLIDDRWQIKITDYGLPFLRNYSRMEKADLLWTAPEILRNENAEHTKEADVYSFAIICSEILKKTSAFDMENRKEKPEEIIYQIKKGGFNPMRPSLEDDDAGSEISPALLQLVRDCWTERPSERPNVNQIKMLIRDLSDGRKANLMDHVFNIMETYASTLEDEVSERTKELVEEKKKSDVLLYRMLPREVAEKLKLGQAVTPETFELVTIFFSDVVSFTKLAGKCTPLQVVNLLNDLYTVFDGIIEQHDVYKVETIGDGYLCVSGLPKRNGNEHGRHIARMALAFMSSLQYFRIPHIPGERINLRIGINCAGQIHISSEANDLLVRVVGGFITESRGEVIIKGKGVMETFWLLGEEEESQLSKEPVQSIIKENKKARKPSVARSVTPVYDDGSKGLYTQFKQSHHHHKA